MAAGTTLAAPHPRCIFRTLASISTWRLPCFPSSAKAKAVAAGVRRNASKHVEEAKSGQVKEAAKLRYPANKRGVGI